MTLSLWWANQAVSAIFPFPQRKKTFFRSKQMSCKNILFVQDYEVFGGPQKIELAQESIFCVLTDQQRNKETGDKAPPPRHRHPGVHHSLHHHLLDAQLLLSQGHAPPCRRLGGGCCPARGLGGQVGGWTWSHTGSTGSPLTGRLRPRRGVQRPARPDQESYLCRRWASCSRALPWYIQPICYAQVGPVLQHFSFMLVGMIPYQCSEVWQVRSDKGT